MHRITKRLAGSVLLGLMVEIMAVQPAHPYLIEWKSPSNITENILVDVQTSTGDFDSRDHKHTGGSLVDGLVLSAFTVTSTEGGPTGAVNNFMVQDIITRDFEIKRSAPSELLTVGAILSGEVQGFLVQNTRVQIGVLPFANFVVNAGILPVLSDSTRASGASVSQGDTDVNLSFFDTATLAVDTPYTLKLTLATGAFSVSDSPFIKQAASNFFSSGFASAHVGFVPEPAALLLFVSGLAGLAAWRRGTHL